jgi:zinc transport system substrate-binding protein
LTTVVALMKMVVMPHWWRVGGLLTGAVLLLSAGCTRAPQPGAAASPDRLTIVAAAYPFQFVAERVAGSHGQVSSLTSPGSEPHDVELTPRQTASVIDADLVVYEKGFQPAVDEAVAQSGRDNDLDTTTVVPLQDLGTEHGHDHEGGEEHGAESGLDPHVWLDPAHLATIGAAVAERLAAADPDRAGDYADNAAALQRDLTTLGEEFRVGLANCERREFITSHAAFGYLAERYRLTQLGISGLSPDVEPSPARIAEVQAEARAHGITTIFYETLVSPDVARSIADDLGLRTDVLDPVEGITPQSRGTDYLSVMRSNLTALRTANGCR